MNGQEVAEHIRRADPEARILFVSGFVPTEAVAELTAPLLRKPYRAATLLETISGLLGN